ncbi:MAG: hypothetical protein OXE85_08845 [Roseovarius sp.]|nr:hypothetical protein [Roseovarius sp.]
MVDIAGLEDYLRQSEGEPPPVFKGREDILTALRDCGEQTRKIIEEPGRAAADSFARDSEGHADCSGGTGRGQKFDSREIAKGL